MVTREGFSSFGRTKKSHVRVGKSRQEVEKKMFILPMEKKMTAQAKSGSL